MQMSSIALCCSLLTLAITLAESGPASAEAFDDRVTCSLREICSLQDSGPIVASHDGQVIEGLRIRAEGRPGIVVHDLANVVVRNVEIHHSGAHGIACDAAPGLLIENVSIVHSGKMVRSHEENNINCAYSDDLRIVHARLERGSSGIWIVGSRHAHLRYIEGYHFRGPFPRGQLAQFDTSPDCILEDFSVINHPSISWTEDNVSVYHSDNCIIRRGLIHGNNSPSGVGVMFEYSNYGLVEDVDTVAQGNGSFSAYPGHDITFRRTRVRDNICADQGRGRPLSDALVWAGAPESSGLRIEESTHFGLCNPENLVWSEESFDIIEIHHEDFSPRPAVVNEFTWERKSRTRANRHLP